VSFVDALPLFLLVLVNQAKQVESIFHLAVGDVILPLRKQRGGMRTDGGLPYTSRVLPSSLGITHARKLAFLLVVPRKQV
jgi:hypothetical protein